MSWRRRIAEFINPPKPKAAAYTAAGSGRRFKGWNQSRASADAAIFTDGDVLRARARQITRENPWAANGIEAWVANAIGTGIIPSPQHPDMGIRETLLSYWAQWCRECDADGTTDFYGLQALAFRAAVEAGEVLLRRRTRRPEDGLVVPLQYQILESEHLPFHYNVPRGAGQNRVSMGIEYDGIGRRTAYHLYREHPDSFGIFGANSELARVPADQIMHLFRPLRPGQSRGATWLAQTIIKLNDLYRYDDAELVRKNMAAMLVWWITEIDSSDPVLAAANPEETDAAGEEQVKLEPGTAIRLKPGESQTMTQGADVGQMYGEFMRVQLSAVAAAMGITYEMLSNDLTKVNYSSIRTGLLEFRRRCEMIQWHMMVFQMCAPVWREFVSTLALIGAINASDFRRNRALYEAVEWRTPRWSWVDPLKDVKAELEEIEGGLKSRQQSVAERGYDVEQIDREQAEDQKRADGYGLVYSTDGRRNAKNPDGSMLPHAEDDEERREMVQ